MFSKFTTIARLYAEAVFDCAVAHQKVEHWQYMLTFFTEIVKNEQVEKILLSNSIAPEILVDLFVLICEGKLDHSSKNLICVMAENNRLIMLPEVLKQFVLLRERNESVIKIQIISSDVLREEELSRITSAVKKSFFRKSDTDCKIDCEIDKSIIAGIIVHLEDDVVIDGSIRRRLERLADVLQS